MKIVFTSTKLIAATACLSLFLFASASTARAQYRTTQDGPRRHLLDHTVPPGRAGLWAGATGRVTPGFHQRASIQVEGGGTVTFFGMQQQNGVTFASPANAGFEVGHVYRLKISNLPNLPGVSVYPTIELIDRIHPPQGKEQKFAVPITITRGEIQSALNDQLVTKVIYLEQPQLANPTVEQNETLRTETLPHHRNLIAEADQRGRPLLIFRMGGRIPDSRNPQEMLGTRGTLSLPAASGPTLSLHAPQ